MEVWSSSICWIITHHTSRKISRLNGKTWIDEWTDMDRQMDGWTDVKMNGQMER